MTFANLRTVLLAGAVIVVGTQSSAFAASPVTNAFLANIQANVAFLDRSSRIASDHALSANVRTFARGESEEQGKLASALDNLMPLLAATDGAVVTGRSVAIDGSIDTGAAPVGLGQAANGRSPMVEADLDRLAARSGRSFDDLYWQTQLDALSQIEADYRAYVATGDDPVLVAMAKDELPKIVHRLELLSKI